MTLLHPERPSMEKNIDTDTVYVFIRQDLEQSLQMVHVAHALEQRVHLHNEIGHPIITVIGVPDEARLVKAFDFIGNLGYRCYLWSDPDEKERGNLSFSTEPLSILQKQHIKKYRLWREENNRISSDNREPNPA